jgi:hypothetical protein
MATESEQPNKRRKLGPSFAYDPFDVGKGDLLTSCSNGSPEAIVTFLIGPGDSPKKFIVHKEHACHHSPILNAAFNGNFVEGQTQTYRIEDTSPGAFQFFVQWLYRQEVDLFQLRNFDTTEEDEPQMFAEDMDLAELWVLADKMAMPPLQNLVVSKIIEIREETLCVAVNTLHYIYRTTAIDSPLRRLMVSEVANCSYQRDFSDDSEMFPHAFLIDLAQYMTALQSKNGKYKANASDFFVSLSGEGNATGGS